jgi:hypothetical protein
MKKLYLVILFALFAIACKKEKESSSKTISSFIISHTDNPILTNDIQGVIKNDTVTITLPNDTLSKTLIPTINVSTDAIVRPASKQKEDFSKPVTYHVEASDGSYTTYIVVYKPAVVLPSLAQLKNLKINGADCGYDSVSSTFYYPVSLGATLNNYTISFTNTNAVAVTLNTTKITTGQALNIPLTTNQQLQLQAVDKFSKATNYNVIITGLPIVELTASQTIGDDKVSGLVNLVNPDYVAQGSQLEISSNIMISIRGATSRQYPKNAYLMGLVDAQGNDSDVSLLGLRTDNSWILDAMYIDQARMRNRVCTDIWNSFNNVPYIASEPTALNGTRGYMTELFLNHQYWGIYCLTEKVDRKQLQIKKNYGDMYKATDYTSEVQFDGVLATDPYDNTSETWGGWQFEYPDIGDTPAPNWSYLYNIVNFVGSSSDATFASQVAAKIDINNMVDYFLFMNVLEAQDNHSKNTYLSFYDYRVNSPFFYSVWDLDGTIGRSYDGTPLPNQMLGAYGNNLFQRLLDLNPNNFKQLLKTRWNSLKTNQFSKSVVNARIEAYRKLLVNTNAFTRERAKWTNITQDLNTETSTMETWYSAQYDLMDSYINGL